ncbi:MAG: dTDP-4-dehydrorhamnose reductase [Saprospiraceae bacterium]|nr:dTDP-4-dehydrorhamnose reductase [Saprospiraceae bacterium]MCB9321096.1 dTDP-4-dehydrorhamnose reductase [Lewinellaceae bacterium]
MPRPRVMILGAGGQVGREFRYLHELQAWNWEPHFFNRSELDLSHTEELEKTIRDLAPQVIINAAAYTAVDRAESEPELAFLINAEAPGQLAGICAAKDIFLIHFSTDYVYHNGLNQPLREEDPLQPHSVYARSKLAGEQAISKILPESLIFRTSWVYSAFGHNFVKTMLRLGKERRELRVVDDQIGSPTWARDLAQAVLQILEENPGDLSKYSGIYNYSNEGVCSWYEFAKAIFREAHLDVVVHPIPTSEYPTPAVRPPYSVLDKTRFKETFQLPIPSWEESLKGCLKEISGIH